jgi:ribosomal protein S18 acetylase RimI-like enzyme
VLQFTPITAEHWDVLEPMIADFCVFENISFSSSKGFLIWQKAFEHPEFFRAWLLEFEFEVVGYVVLTFGFSLEYGGLDAYVDELWINPRFRGRSFASQALEFLSLECKKLNVAALHLEVDSDNHAAKSLYAKMGFESTKRELLNKVLL